MAEESRFVPRGDMRFSLLHKDQDRSESHTTSIQWVARAVFSGLKRQRREADNSLPSSAEVKKGGIISPLSHINEMGNILKETILLPLRN
jgi:hypothetical protein